MEYNTQNGKEAWKVVLEDAFITFLMVLIPKLILLGHPPTSLAEIYEPFLSSLLMGIYSWARYRNIQIPKEEEKGSVVSD